MRKVVVYVLASAVVLLGLAFLASRVFIGRPNLDVGSAATQATVLIAKVGGSDEVLREAGQMFERFGTSELRFLSVSDVGGFPAIAALGEVNGIWPDDGYEPAHIVIHIGTHFDGYFIEIWDTNRAGKYVVGSNVVEVVKSRISVHR